MRERNKDGNVYVYVCWMVGYVAEMVDDDSGIQCQGEELH